MTKSKITTPSAGRPTEVDAPVVRIFPMVDAKTKEFLLKLGGGNISKGIREAVRRLEKK
jgi:hypothetical protein